MEINTSSRCFTASSVYFSWKLQWIVAVFCGVSQRCRYLYIFFQPVFEPTSWTPANLLRLVKNVSTNMATFPNSFILFLNHCHSFRPFLLLMKRKKNKDGRRLKETEIKWWAAVTHCVSLKDINWVIYSRRYIRPSVFSDRFGVGMYVCVCTCKWFYLWRGVVK